MGKESENSPGREVPLPPPRALRQAIQIYLQNAYAGSPPPAALRFLPSGDDFDAAAFLMGELVERSPAEAPLALVRTFDLRLGNGEYSHMKLRIAILGEPPGYIFSVDSHDLFLKIKPGDPDYEALEELKKVNGAIAARITAAWEAAGHHTERTFLREKIRQARKEKSKPG